MWFLDLARSDVSTIYSVKNKNLCIPGRLGAIAGAAKLNLCLLTSAMFPRK